MQASRSVNESKFNDTRLQINILKWWQTYLKNSVNFYNRSYIIYCFNCYKHSLGQALFPQFCIIYHNSKIVCQFLTVIMNVVD